MHSQHLKTTQKFNKCKNKCKDIYNDQCLIILATLGRTNASVLIDYIMFNILLFSFSVCALSWCVYTMTELLITRDHHSVRISHRPMPSGELG